MKALYLCLSLLPFVQMYAQSANPEKAYYVDAEGDTIHTTINLDSDEMLSKQIRVWTSDKFFDHQKIRAENILSLGFPNQGLVFVQLDHEIPDNEDVSKKIGVKRLAKRLITGPVQLYELHISRAEQNTLYADLPPFVYYLQTADGNFFRLDQEEKRQGSGQQFQVVEKFKGVLRYALRDWDKADALIDRTRFSRESLSKLIYQYGKFLYPDQYEREKEKSKETTVIQLSFRLLGASGYKATGVLSSSPESASLTALGGGAMLEFSNRAISNNLVIGIGLEYLAFLGSVDDPFNTDEAIITDGGLLRIPLDLKVILNQKAKIKPFLNAGMSAIIKPKLVGLNLPRSEVPTIRYHLGAGVDVGKFSLFYRKGWTIKNTIGLSYRL